MGEDDLYRALVGSQCGEGPGFNALMTMSRSSEIGTVLYAVPLKIALKHYIMRHISQTKS